MYTKDEHLYHTEEKRRRAAEEAKMVSRISMLYVEAGKCV